MKILTQNQKMAVAVGKYAKDRDPVVEQRFPAWQYHCGRNARDAHSKLNGKVFLKSDPIWRKIYPPWEFNCNCWVTNSDENPSPPLKPEDEPKPPASGYAFNPADAFEDYKVDDIGHNKKELTVVLKYKGKGNVPVIEGLTRVSKPSCRVYVPSDKIPRVLGGLGIAVLSTSSGVMTDRAARKQNVGGELLCYVW